MSCAVPTGPLDPTERVSRYQLVQPSNGDEQLVGGGREPLAERRGLSGDIVGASHDDQLVELDRTASQPGEYREGLVPNELQGGPHLQLLDVLGHVTARHALVDLLLPG